MCSRVMGLEGGVGEVPRILGLWHGSESDVNMIACGVEGVVGGL